MDHMRGQNGPVQYVPILFPRTVSHINMVSASSSFRIHPSIYNYSMLIGEKSGIAPSLLLILNGDDSSKNTLYRLFLLLL
ncbi:unnamed protein product [Danaus chrysippus]|uniref:(African queen) hypothetical protein n=1 Tax=Danaus chrysippus TaxID=151541 RepID=A0A8J2W153_9NEOP|nr:unnamed protein product [Danaus chrysippus]